MASVSHNPVHVYSYHEIFQHGRLRLCVTVLAISAIVYSFHVSWGHNSSNKHILRSILVALWVFVPYDLFESCGCISYIIFYSPYGE